MLLLTNTLLYIEQLSYVGVYVSIVLSGHVLPIPEEVTLLLAGYVSAKGIANLYLMMVTGILGSVSGDLLLFYLSLKGSPFVKKIKTGVSVGILVWYSNSMSKHPKRTLFFSRFIPGVRLLNPLVAGFHDISPSTFALFSFLPALIFIPVLMVIGFVFQYQIDAVIETVRSLHRGVIIVIVLVVLVSVFYSIYRKLSQKKLDI
ncbi:MAG: DedA family protein [Parcubacteria group bacterium]|nr:DedA family protein [Parcubacteria group bacterium]